MIEFLQQVDWKFVVGDIVIPIATFIIGLFVGKGIEKKRAKASITGNNNKVMQNIEIKKG